MRFYLAGSVSGGMQRGAHSQRGVRHTIGLGGEVRPAWTLRRWFGTMAAVAERSNLHIALGAAAGAFVALTDYIAPDDSVTGPLVAADAAAFAAENNITPGCL